MNLGAFFAEIIYDALSAPHTWHSIVQRTGSAEILFWGQDASEGEAQVAARGALKDLCDAQQAGVQVAPQPTIGDKKFRTLRETTHRLRSPR